MEMYQIWIRKRNASCSHTETVYLKAPDEDFAWAIADALFHKCFQVKAVLPKEKWLEQESCGCGNSITVEK